MCLIFTWHLQCWHCVTVMFLLAMFCLHSLILLHAHVTCNRYHLGVECSDNSFPFQITTFLIPYSTFWVWMSNISSLFFNSFNTYKCVNIIIFRFISNIIYTILIIKGQETCTSYLHSKQNTCLFIIWSVFDYQTLISELVSDHASLTPNWCCWMSH